MFNKLSIVAACPFVTIVSGSSGIVFNLNGASSSGGLLIQSMFERIMYIESSSAMSRAGTFLSSEGDSVHLIAEGRLPVSVPLTQPYEPLLCLNNPARLSITPGSSFAAHFRTAMLVPPSEEHPSFRLMAGLTNPETHCFEGTIGYADLPRDTIRFNVQVSLVASHGRTFASRASASQLDATRTPFGISTHEKVNVVPFDIFEAWRREVLTVAGVTDHAALATIDWSTFLHQLPSIQYTIYRSDDSDEVAARIVLQPEDFIEVLPAEANVMLSPGFVTTRPSLGLTALKHVSVFLDYENSRIGFCEPI